MSVSLSVLFPLENFSAPRLLLRLSCLYYSFLPSLFGFDHHLHFLFSSFACACSCACLAFHPSFAGFNTPCINLCPLVCRGSSPSSYRPPEFILMRSALCFLDLFLMRQGQKRDSLLSIHPSPLA